MSILRPLYPTHQQIKDLFEAHEKGGTGGNLSLPEEAGRGAGRKRDPGGFLGYWRISKNPI